MQTLLRFTRRYMAPYAHWFAAGIIALLVTNWLSVTIPLYVADAIDALVEHPDPGPIVAGDAGWIAAMGLVIIVVRWASRMLFFTPGRLIEASVKRDLFERLLHQQPAFVSRWPTGDLVSRASGDINFLRLIAGFGALQGANVVIAFALAGLQMVRLSPHLTLWLVGPLLFGGLFIQLFIRWMFLLVHRMQALAARLSDQILSSYQGISTVHGFVAEEAFIDRFRETNIRYLKTSLQRADMRAAIGPTLALAAAIDMFILLYVGGPMAIRGEVTVGELVAFTTLVAFLTGPLRSSSFLASILKQAQAALERIDEIMLPEPERPDLPDPLPAPTSPPEIEFRDLSFTYPGSDRPSLRNVTLRVPAGSTLGVLGSTGSGKSTLMRCLARLYNPPPGTVFVDGEDILDIDLDDWRRQLAYVPQRAFLFSESIRDNVLLGSDTDERLSEVLHLAAMDVDLQALPHGIDSVVGESGLTLSGGQRQRTALARGLFRPHQVLVLDDVLSAVDHATEHQLIEALRSTGVAPTTLIVSHRISALQHADRIAVIRDGALEATGTHEELLLCSETYRDTWEHQRDTEGHPRE